MPTQFSLVTDDSAVQHVSDDLRSQRASLAAAPHVQAICDAVPIPVLVINGRRQLVLTNTAGMELLGISPTEDWLGLYTGDVLRCLNRDLGPDGCGTSAECRDCGLRESLVQAMADGTAEIECTIVTEMQPMPIECLASANRIEVDGGQYVLLTLTDQRAANRRRILEKLFFHDVLNTAGNLMSISQLLPGSEGDEALELQALMTDQAKRLADEMRAQRDLTAAEAGELAVDLQAVSMVRLIAEIVDSYHHHPLASERELVVRPGPAVRAAADPVLLGRALGNLVKNALEATPPGGRVTVAHGVVDDRIELRVLNPGEVPEHLHHHLFRRMASTKGAGRGLGTYSVRLLVEEYLGGSVGFRSSPDDGTVFWIKLGAPLNTSLVR